MLLGRTGGGGGKGGKVAEEERGNAEVALFLQLRFLG